MLQDDTGLFYEGLITVTVECRKVERSYFLEYPERLPVIKLNKAKPKTELWRGAIAQLCDALNQSKIIDYFTVVSS